ncbi:MAG: hypothetical protein K2N79_02285 [Muribaculaceae bacterium]|nr:hypothetical protein [Muribaculaceae bacterium]
MTKKFIITAIAFLFFSVVNISADNNSNDTDVSEDETIQIIDVPKPPISGRPRSANWQQINCKYTNGILYIQFAVAEGNCELTVIDSENGEVVIYNFDSSTSAFINTGSHATFELYILTENGNCYYGSK